MKGKKNIVCLAGMILASAALAGCQSSRSNYPGGGMAQGGGWGGNTAMARQNTTTTTGTMGTAGMGGGTMVSQNGTMAAQARMYDSSVGTAGTIGTYVPPGSPVSGTQPFSTGAGSQFQTTGARTSSMSGAGMSTPTTGYTQDSRYDHVGTAGGMNPTAPKFDSGSGAMPSSTSFSNTSMPASGAMPSGALPQVPAGPEASNPPVPPAPPSMGNTTQRDTTYPARMQEPSLTPGGEVPPPLK